MKPPAAEPCDDQRARRRPSQKRQRAGDRPADQRASRVAVAASHPGSEIGSGRGRIPGGLASTWRARSSSSTTCPARAQPASSSQVKQRRGGEPRVSEADRCQQGARRGDDAVAGQPAEALRRQHADGAEGQRRHTAPDQHVAAEQRRRAGAGGKAQAPQPQHRVDADLGQHREQRRRRRAGRRIAGSPEFSGQAALWPARRRRDRRPRGQHTAVAAATAANAGRCRPCLSVPVTRRSGHADQEQQRRQQIRRE